MIDMIVQPQPQGRQIEQVRIVISNNSNSNNSYYSSNSTNYTNKNFHHLQERIRQKQQQQQQNRHQNQKHNTVTVFRNHSSYYYKYCSNKTNKRYSTGTLQIHWMVLLYFIVVISLLLLLSSPFVSIVDSFQLKATTTLTPTRRKGNTPSFFTRKVATATNSKSTSLFHISSTKRSAFNIRAETVLSLSLSSSSSLEETATTTKTSNNDVVDSSSGSSSCGLVQVNMIDIKDDTIKEQYYNKTILLTGASGGLGSALARFISSCQPNTVILSARRENIVQQLINECQIISSIATTFNTSIISSVTKQPLPIITTKFYCIICDLEDPISVNELGIQALRLCTNNKIDILINNGGVSSRGTFIDTPIDVDRRIMQINFFAGVALCKIIIPNMLVQNNINQNNNLEETTTSSSITTKQKKNKKILQPIYGRIIWISSIQGLVAIPSRTSYGASKFAVQGYCDSMRAELYTSNVLIHCISPGYIRTDLSKSAFTANGTPSGIVDTNSLTGADPDDVALEILTKVSRNKFNFTVAATKSAIIAICLRLLCPNLLHSILVKRFIKSQQQESSSEIKPTTTTTTTTTTTSDSNDTKSKKSN